MGTHLQSLKSNLQKNQSNRLKKTNKKWIKPTNLDTPKSSPSSDEPVLKVNVPKSESNSSTTSEPSPEMSKVQFDKVISLLFWNLNGKLDEFDRFFDVICIRMFSAEKSEVKKNNKFFTKNLILSNVQIPIRK